MEDYTSTARSTSGNTPSLGPRFVALTWVTSLAVLATSPTQVARDVTIRYDIITYPGGEISVECTIELSLYRKDAIDFNRGIGIVWIYHFEGYHCLGGKCFGEYVDGTVKCHFSVSVVV